MSRQEDGLNLYACRQRWQAFGDEDKTLSLWALLPRPLLRVGPRDVDTVGLVWWNWFDKRETVTSANKTQFRIHTLEKKLASLWTPSLPLFSLSLPLAPPAHMQRLSRWMHSPVCSHKSPFFPPKQNQEILDGLYLLFRGPTEGWRQNQMIADFVFHTENNLSLTCRSWAEAFIEMWQRAR